MNKADLALPTFDIQFPLAQALAYHRYRNHLDKKLREEAQSPLVRASCEHFIRIQRIAECASACATAGTLSEAEWFVRPCFELLSSQSLIHFGPIQGKLGPIQDPIERAVVYFDHSNFVQRNLLEANIHWEGNNLTLEERKAKLKELGGKLKKSLRSFERGMAWHGLEAQVAYELGMEGRRKAFGNDVLEIEPKFAKMIKDFINSGLHGDSFSAKDMHVKEGDGVVSILDHRKSVLPSEARWELTSLIANLSMELVADLFGQRPQVKGIIASAKTDVENLKDRFVGPFPTVYVHML